MYWYCLSLFWSPLEVSGAARGHLRVFAALKSLVFVFSALQLRSGYPPPASYQYAPADVVCAIAVAEVVTLHARTPAWLTSVLCDDPAGVAGAGILSCSPGALA